MSRRYPNIENDLLDAAIDERLSCGDLYRDAAEDIIELKQRLAATEIALRTERAASAAFRRQTERIRQRYETKVGA